MVALPHPTRESGGCGGAVVISGADGTGRLFEDCKLPGLIRGRDFALLALFLTVLGILFFVSNYILEIARIPTLSLPDFGGVSAERTQLVESIRAQAEERPATALDPVPAPATGEGDDFLVPGGRFFTQAADEPGYGYAVTDADGALFWTEFQSLGGVKQFGYPISQRFAWDGIPTQVFQKGVLQWPGSAQGIFVVNVLDLLHDRGHDEWLRAQYGVPSMANWSADSGRGWDETVEAHQALLTDMALRDAYFAPSDPMLVYGLPMAPIDNQGNVLVLRTQRAILQRWQEDMPWAKTGEVTTANVGDIAKEVGLFDDAVAAE